MTTILQKARQSRDGLVSAEWPKFGQADHVVRHTDVWEQENFQEEQARWERSDPEYARICDEVRRAPKTGEMASRHADQAKAEWDARVAPQRQADDDARRAHHWLEVKQESQTLDSAFKDGFGAATQSVVSQRALGRRAR